MKYHKISSKYTIILQHNIGQPKMNFYTEQMKIMDLK